MFSAIVSVGPWLMTTISLLVMSLLFPLEANDNYALFSIATIYCFIFSTIFSGGFIMVIVRRVADLVYAKNYSAILEEYNGVFLTIGISAFAVSVIWILCFGPDVLWVKIYFPLLFTILSLLWVTLSFISVIQKYKYIVIGFAAGSILAFIIPWFLKQINAGPNSFFGYILGFSFTLSYLIFVLFRELPNRKKLSVSFEFLKAFKTYPENFLFGIFYYLGIWIDDILIWSSSFGGHLFRGFNYSEFYDLPMFLAYLSIIPSLALFFMVVETDFYKKYRKFYTHIEEGSILKELEYDLEEMKNTLNNRLGFVLKIQILVSILLFIFTDLIAARFITLEFNTLIFRIGIIGAFFNACFLMLQLFLLYFEFRKEVMITSGIVFLINLIMTVLTLNFFPEYLGISYTISFALGTLISKRVLDNKLSDLIRIEYSRQPLGLAKGHIIREKYQK